MKVGEAVGWREAYTIARPVSYAVKEARDTVQAVEGPKLGSDNLERQMRLPATFDFGPLQDAKTLRDVQFRHLALAAFLAGVVAAGVVGGGYAMATSTLRFLIGPIVAAVFSPILVFTLASDWDRIYTSMSVDAAGIEFKTAKGRTRRVSWADERFKLDFYYTQGASDGISRGQPYVGIDERQGLRTRLPMDAYEFIVDQAASRGLAVSRRQAGGLGWAIIQIRSSRISTG